MNITKLTQEVIAGKKLEKPEALYLAQTPPKDMDEFLTAAQAIREAFVGKKAFFCTITNAKSGRCPEDCSFCAQSSRYPTKVNTYSLRSPQELAQDAETAEEMGGHCFSIVLSGQGFRKEQELVQVAAAISMIKSKTQLKTCVSGGAVRKDQARRLKEAGLDSYHHNIETSRTHFPKICTTHSYPSRLATIKAAKEVGLKLCSGGIFGVGEDWEDRVEMALLLRELGADSIPLNFLNPIAGTPLGNKGLLPKNEALKIIALFRFLLPDKKITVSGGREVTLKEEQSQIFAAGANGLLLGNYLTTNGRDYREDLEMVKQMGMERG
jgi:biotin synthase